MGRRGRRSPTRSLQRMALTVHAAPLRRLSVAWSCLGRGCSQPCGGGHSVLSLSLRAVTRPMSAARLAHSVPQPSESAARMFASCASAADWTSSADAARASCQRARAATASGDGRYRGVGSPTATLRR